MPVRTFAVALYLIALETALFSFAPSALGQSPSADAPGVQPTLTGSPARSDGGTPIVVPTQSSSGNFFKRFAKAYADDWKEVPSTDAAPATRGMPSPVDGPPFPF